MGRKYKSSDEKKYKIKLLCQLHNTSYDGLAKFLDVTTQTISNWANIPSDDNRSVPGDFLLRMAFFFEVTMEQMHSPHHFKTLQKAS